MGPLMKPKATVSPNPVAEVTVHRTSTCTGAIVQFCQADIIKFTHNR